MLLVLGLLGAGLCALLALNTAAAADEVRQRTLTAENADNRDTTQQLALTVAQKQAPAALASQARALGLVPDPNPAFLVVRADGTVVVMGSAVPVSPPVALVATPPKPTAALTPTPPATSANPAPSSGATLATTSPAATKPAPSASVGGTVATLPGGPR